MTQVADGVYRLGSGWLNWYIVEEDGSLAVIDSGLPGHWAQLPDLLSSMRASLADIHAVVLTHSHLDHVGVMARIKEEAGAEIFVHETDAPIVRGEAKAKPPPGFVTNVWRPRMLRLMADTIANGGGKRPRTVERVNEFEHGEILDVPGRPRVVHTPGHSPSHCAFVLERRGVLFSGDGLVTAHPWKKVRGPQLNQINEDRERALESLDIYGSVDASVLLPGHGDPWSGKTVDAVRQAKSFLQH